MQVCIICKKPFNAVLRNTAVSHACACILPTQIETMTEIKKHKIEKKVFTLRTASRRLAKSKSGPTPDEPQRKVIVTNGKVSFEIIGFEEV